MWGRGGQEGEGRGSGKAGCGGEAAGTWLERMIGAMRLQGRQVLVGCMNMGGGDAGRMGYGSGKSENFSAFSF